MRNRSDSVKSLTLLRGVAALLVVFDHWKRDLMLKNLVSDSLTSFIDAVIKPFSIIQDFGFMAVSIFFFISGFVISNAASRETRAQFIIRRMFRIYPPLIFAVLGTLLISQDSSSFKATEILNALSLGNYISGTRPIVGVAWTLIIELQFYILIFLIVPFIKSRFLYVQIFSFLIVFLVIKTCRAMPINSFKAPYFLFAASFSYVPLLIIGQTIWAYWIQLIKIRYLVISLISFLFLFMYSLHEIHTQFLEPNNLYGPSIIYALCIFVLALYANLHLRKIPTFLMAISISSYSIYLFHDLAMELQFSIFNESRSPIFVLLVSSSFLVTLTYISYSMVEKPSIRFGRNLSNSNKLFLKQ